MPQICQPDDVQQLGTIVSVWAHPDDESFLAAGLLATAVRNGQTVVCVTATRGEAGIQDESRWPAAQLGAIRQQELAAGLQELGVAHHHWLNYIDTQCASVDQAKAIEQLFALMASYRPDTILTFGPDGWTGHPDHQAVSAWVDAAVEQLPKKPRVYHVVSTPDHFEKYLKPADKLFDIFFNIDQPPLLAAEQCDIYYQLPLDIAEQKCRALQAQPSQTAIIFQTWPQAQIMAMESLETFVLK